ncbi:MAG: hypothetical protein Q8R47_05080 [Nanoarchaeota archaeon]|nr:hypothetical protein [Nanoarchaeota archaeon]
MKKRKIFIFGIALSLGSIMAWAETIPGIPGEIALPQNFIIDALQPVLQKVGIFIGGIFGIYLIVNLINIYNERKKVRLLKDIRNDVDLLTKHFGVKHSHEKKGILRRLFGFLLPEDEAEKKSKK